MGIAGLPEDLAAGLAGIDRDHPVSLSRRKRMTPWDGRCRFGLAPTSAMVFTLSSIVADALVVIDAALIASAPHRLALPEEGGDALAGILRQHVLDHDPGGVGVGLGQAHLGLAVEGLLAGLHRQRRLRGDGVRHISSTTVASIPAARRG